MFNSYKRCSKIAWFCKLSTWKTKSRWRFFFFQKYWYFIIKLLFTPMVIHEPVTLTTSSTHQQEQKLSYWPLSNSRPFGFNLDQNYTLISKTDKSSLGKSEREIHTHSKEPIMSVWCKFWAKGALAHIHLKTCLRSLQRKLWTLTGHY